MIGCAAPGDRHGEEPHDARSGAWGFAAPVWDGAARLRFAAAPVCFASAPGRRAGVSTLIASRPSRGISMTLVAAALTVAALLLHLSAASAPARGTAAGTRIVASASASYVTENGDSGTVSSNEAVLVVGQVAAVDVEPPRSTSADPGTVVHFSHTVSNFGNGPDSVDIAASSQNGWNVRVLVDANGDGAPDSGDPEVTGPIELAADESTRLLVTVEIPALDDVEGTTDSITVRAVSRTDGSVSDHVLDGLDVRDLLDVSLQKSVDRATASAGELLTYTIRYETSGETRASDLVITDPIPTGTTYVPGTLRLDGASLTDADDADAGFFDSGRGRVVVRVGDVSGGNSGTVRFQVRVEG